MSTGERSVPAGTRWAIPLTAVVIGGGYLVAGLVGGDRVFAVGGLAVMLAAAAGFLVAARFSETARGLRDRTDERINSLDQQASLWAGMSVLGAVLVMFVVEIARGQDGEPYSALGALGGLVYVVSLLVLRWRR